MSTRIGAYEAKTHLPSLLERVAAGETVVITKHGVPVARLVPTGGVDRPVEDVIAELRRTRVPKRGRRVSIRAMIEEGRR